MDSRKLLRHYTSQPELGLKCSLSGTQAALGERDFWDQVRARLAPSFPQRDGVGALATSGGFWVRSNEHLGAVATIKRLAPHRKAAQISVATFPSTGSIASTDFRAEVLLRWDALKVPATEFLNVLDSLGVRDLFTTEIGDELEVLAGDDEVRNRWLRYDGETLYPDFFEPRSLADSLGRKASDVDQGLARRARSMLLELYSLSETEPDAYYAILAMDGDRMGQMLSQLVGGDGVDQHERISGALARLAQGLVWDLVRNHRGQLIYAGGDDVLAFVPTRYALKLARALRLAFGEALAAVDVADRTASVGIAIVHHASPLDGALRLAYGAEQVAKGSFERDALVVRLARRSGEMREVGLRWPDVIGNNGLELVLERSLAAAGRLSSKMAYDLYQEASALARTPEAWRPEIGRLLRRHVDLSAFQRESDEFGAEVSAIEALAEKLAQLAVAWPARNGRSGIEQLAEWLLVLRFAAQREAL
jgi:CRISPR-associated protein Cmr2